MQSSDIVGLIVLLCLVVMGVMGAKGLRMISDHQDSSEKLDKLVLSVIQESTKSQRLMTCIMSIEQSKREPEYRDPDSFCHKMAAPQ